MTQEERDELRTAAERWIAGDPDPRTREELRELLEAGDVEALREHVGGVLEFGTAGIRGVVGPGSLRMNRAVVIRTSRGLADHVLAVHGAAAGPVVVGFDARLDSERFATDTVAVLAAAGLTVRYVPSPTPTPLVAYAARALGAVAAVVVTASHNPPEYNGYKVYAANGAQIVPPEDAAIAAAIAAVGPAVEVPRAGHDLASIAGAGPVPDDLFSRYLADVDAVRPATVRDRDLVIAYTPLHGVGGEPVRRALSHGGYDQVHVVEEQARPDGRFPTVAFPNPEEPGALDLAVALATDVGADLLVANDPDVDRLAVGLPDGDTFRLLTGNQIGALLGDYLLEHADAPRPLVVSSIVSSPMLATIARARGARHEATLTGFKWICNAALELERADGLDFVFGYEEALGYTVGTVVRDKDGISAAVVFADLAASLRAQGRTVRDQLESLYRTHGLWISHQHSAVRPGLEGQQEIAEAMTRLSAQRHPTELAGRTVTAVTDYRTGADRRPPWLARTDLVELSLGEQGGRALVRPSGTEPKLKVYVDLVDRVSSDVDLATAEHTLRDRAVTVAEELVGFLEL